MATLLRAEAAAVLTLDRSDVKSVFTHRIDPGADWRTILGGANLDRAARSATPVSCAIPAGRWDEGTAFALLVRLDTLETPSLMCVLRHAVPFDPIEIASAEAAAALLGTGLPERPVPGDDSVDLSATIARLERDAATLALPLRVLVAEAQPATRIGLRVMLGEAGLAVVGECASLAEAIALARAAKPDVVVLDTAVPDAGGASPIERLRLSLPGVEIVAFAAESGLANARAALRAGARALVRKDATADVLVAAVRAAAAGLVALHPDDVPSLAGERPAAPAHVEDIPDRVPGEPLSPRELELLRHLAEGYTNKEIARLMVLAEDTVKKAVQTLIAKLGATDRTSAVVRAMRASLID